MSAAIVIGLTFAAGLWLFAAAVWPARQPLQAALGQLRAAGRPRRVVAAAPAGSLAGAVGRWAMRRLGASPFASERTLTDLAILRRPAELHAGTTVLCAIGGGCAGPVLWLLGTAVGVSLPVLVPVWFLAVGALAGWLLPRAALRAAAAAARRDFRHALGAYLDVLVLMLAAQEGPESAMELAAHAGSGPAFDDLQQATWQARLSGDAVWTALDDLGRTLGIIELREVAATGVLAGESGAAVRKSLVAKARSLRTASLTAAETAARRQSQAMFAPLVLMGLAFIVFMIYPLVTNLSVGAP